MILKWFRQTWEFINRMHPETRSLVIILLFGYILYSQITEETRRQNCERYNQEIRNNKQAEDYAKKASVELNREIQLIAEKDKDAFDVILLNYHNNTQSLQGYKYLYLSCLTEAPRDLDTPLIGKQWNKIDYTYYADELAKIHGKNVVKISNIEEMGKYLPKLYRLIKASDAKAISFFTIVGPDSEIGMVILLYKEPKEYNSDYSRIILPSIQRLAILLDYENSKK